MVGPGGGWGARGDVSSPLTPSSYSSPGSGAGATAEPSAEMGWVCCSAAAADGISPLDAGFRRRGDNRGSLSQGTGFDVAIAHLHCVRGSMPCQTLGHNALKDRGFCVSECVQLSTEWDNQMALTTGAITLKSFSDKDL